MKKNIQILLLIISLSPVFAQTRTNLNIIESLIDRSLQKADSLLDNRTQNIFFEFLSPTSYSFLKSKALASLSSKGYTLKAESSGAESTFQYSISNIGVRYLNALKTGFFGDITAEREVYIEGSIVVSKGKGELNPQNFSYMYKDTINVDDIPNLENNEYEFTQSPIPEPPLFSNLLEPILVVSTLIVTVILFFVVRSK